MNGQQIAEFADLVSAYLQAYDDRMPNAEILERRGLWSSPPLAAEYNATLAFIQHLPVALERYSSKTIEDFVERALIKPSYLRTATVLAILNCEVGKACRPET
jgi:hypothetical protein